MITFLVGSGGAMAAVRPVMDQVSASVKVVRARIDSYLRIWPRALKRDHSETCPRGDFVPFRAFLEFEIRTTQLRGLSSTYY